MLNSVAHSNPGKEAAVSIIRPNIPHSESLPPCIFPPFLCGFTESYKDLLMDTRRWLKNSDGEIRALLLIKLVEQKTAEIPPPLCLDDRAEDDNYRPGPGEPGYESLDIDPVYESLRGSTKTEDWVGRLDGFAELWRLNHITSIVERDGGRVIILPRGCLPVAITRSGFYATRQDPVATWGLDMERYCDFIGEAANKMAFTRRVRYIKAVEALQEAQKT